MNNDELKDHIFTTYINLRKGIVLLTCLLPILLIGIGLWQDIEIQGSLSAYYHACPDGYEVPKEIKDLATANPSNVKLKEVVVGYSYAYYHIHPKGQCLRAIFVSLLIAVGACLYLYKGFSVAENIALNLAGLFAVMVAMFPMEWKSNEGEIIFKDVIFAEHLSLHGISAVLLVLCVAYVCIFRSSETLELLPEEKLKTRFKTEYKILGILMIVLPLFTAGYMIKSGQGDRIVLLLEIIVLAVFSRYWWTKSREMSISNAEKLALEDKYFNK